jgi:hypothetical protein
MRTDKTFRVARRGSAHHPPRQRFHVRFFRSLLLLSRRCLLNRDLRRTARPLMARAGVRPDIAERVRC